MISTRIINNLLIWYIPFSLVLISITKSRFEIGFGLGEILFIPVIFYALFVILKKNKFSVPLFSLFFIYFLTFCIANTFLSYSNNKPGVFLRDIFALLFAFIFYVSVSSLHLNYVELAKKFVLICLFLVLYYFLFGESDAYYSDVRFTAGGSNPNQIAFYLAAGFSFSLLFYSGLLRIIFSLMFAYFGLATMSDGFTIFMLTVIGGLFFSAISKKYPKYIVLMASIPLILLVWLYYDLIHKDFIEFTLSADKEGSRFVLATNGVYAWFDSLWTAIFGNGAGAFSGEVKFQSTESHNTFIDIGAQFGLIGFFLFCIPYISFIIKNYNAGLIMCVFILLGLTLFMMVHYILRQPVFLFIIYLMHSYYLTHSSKSRPQV